MIANSAIRSEVVRLSRDLRDHIRTIDGGDGALGAALIEVGLEIALRDSRQSVSLKDMEVVRAHHPTATDDDIRSHRLTPEGIGYLLSLLTTFARKYLDHQPEACSDRVACPDDAVVKELVDAVTRNIKNAFASAPTIGVSAYDVAATIITNASMVGSEHGIALEHAAIIHLEGIIHALERAGPTL